MYYDAPSEERKNEMIENIAKHIVNNGLDTAAILFLNNYKSLAYMGTQFGIVMLSPFLMLLGDYEKSGFQSLRLFERKENIEELVQRIEDLKEDMKNKEPGKIGTDKKEEKGIKSILTRIWKLLF